MFQADYWHNATDLTGHVVSSVSKETILVRRGGGAYSGVIALLYAGVLVGVGYSRLAVFLPIYIRNVKIVMYIHPAANTKIMVNARPDRIAVEMSTSHGPFGVVVMMSRRRNHTVFYTNYGRTLKYQQPWLHVTETWPWPSEIGNSSLLRCRHCPVRFLPHE